MNRRMGISHSFGWGRLSAFRAEFDWASSWANQVDLESSNSFRILGAKQLATPDPLSKTALSPRLKEEGNELTLRS